MYLKGIAAGASLLFGLLVLFGGPRRRSNQFLAIFLFLIAGNQAVELYRTMGHEDLVSFRWATVFAILDPVFLYAFASVYPIRNHLAHPLRWIPLAACTLPLFAWVLWITPNPNPATDPRYAWGELALATFTAVAYTLVWLRVLNEIVKGQDVRGYRLLYPAMCIATVPVWWRIANDIPLIISIRIPTAVWQAVFILAYLVVPLISVLVAKRRSATSPGPRPFILRWTWVGVAFTLLMALGAVPVTLGFPQSVSQHLVFAVPGKASAAIRWILFGAFVSTAVLRHEVLGMSLAWRRAASRLLMAYGFVAGAAFIVGLGQTVLGRTTFSLSPLDVAVLGAALLLSQGFRTAVNRMATRWYGVPDPADAAATADAYRAAAAQARERGLQPDAPELVRLRGELGLDDRAVRAIADMMASSASGGPVAPGQVVAGRYKVTRFLGRGGGGRAFLAKDDLLHREIVLKEVLFDSPEEEATILREARLAAGLQHPNVVTLYDVVRRPGSALLVSEYVAGGSLNSRLERGPLDPADAVTIADGILAGLEAIHSQGVVHRDLTPGNVLLARDGTAKIADFGIARARRGVTQRFDEPGESKGTPGFMAPEQRRGQIATTASDVYQMGLLLRALVGPRVPESLSPVVSRALRESASSRWPDAHAMRKALRTRVRKTKLQIR